jgi:hypothetical protein
MIPALSPQLAALPVFGFEPNWDDPVELLHRHLTDIAATDAGREERAARRIYGALKLRYSLDTREHPAAAAAVRRFMLDAIGQQVVVPLWSEAVALTAPVNGATIYHASAASRLFAPDRPLVLWGDHGRCEALWAGAGPLTATQTLASNVISHAYGAGDFLVPAILTAPLTEKQTLRWIAGFQTRGDVEFSEAVEQALPIPSAASLPLFRGLPLFPFRLNRVSEPESTPQRDVLLFDDDAGVVAAVVTELAPRRHLRGELQLYPRAEILAFWAFSAATLGQWGAFWLPSDQPDFVLPQPHDGGAVLTVHGTGYAAGDFPHAARRFLLIRDDGHWHARRIVAAAVNADGSERLTLESAVPSLSTLAVISQLWLVRSTLDELPLRFAGTELASAEIAALEVPQEIADLADETAPADGAIPDRGRLAP